MSDVLISITAKVPQWIAQGLLDGSLTLYRAGFVRDKNGIVAHLQQAGVDLDDTKQLLESIAQAASEAAQNSEAALKNTEQILSELQNLSSQTMGCFAGVAAIQIASTMYLAQKLDRLQASVELLHTKLDAVARDISTIMQEQRTDILSRSAQTLERYKEAHSADEIRRVFEMGIDTMVALREQILAKEKNGIEEIFEHVEFYQAIMQAMALVVACCCACRVKLGEQEYIPDLLDRYHKFLSNQKELFTNLNTSTVFLHLDNALACTRGLQPALDVIAFESKKYSTLLDYTPEEDTHLLVFYRNEMERIPVMR